MRADRISLSPHPSRCRCHPKVAGATLFYVFERTTDDRFKNIPQSLYYVAIFLGGEWAHADFTVGGKILCCALCLLGIGLFSLPIGFLFEALSTVLAERGAAAAALPPDDQEGTGAPSAVSSDGGGPFSAPQSPPRPALFASPRAEQPSGRRSVESVDSMDASINQRLHPASLGVVVTPVAFQVGTPSLGSAQVDHL